MEYIIELVKILVLTVCMLLGVGNLTVMERKYMSGIQRRRGPNTVGLYGSLQFFADGMKLLLKETVIPTSASWQVFMLGPIVTFGLAIGAWAVIPMGEGKVLVDIDVGIAYILAISGLGVYGVIMGGWGSNSKYGFLGGLRSTAQMIAYEVSIGFILVCILLMGGSMNMSEIVRAQESMWYMVPMLPLCGVWLVTIIAETNRHPMDLSEAEAELVSGYNTEYGGLAFGMFFLGEYGNIIMMSTLTTVLFMGGWLAPWPLSWIVIGGPIITAMKSLLIVVLIIWSRAALPRYRYDQLMRLGWKVILPISMGWVMLLSGVLLGMNWLP